MLRMYLGLVVIYLAIVLATKFGQPILMLSEGESFFDGDWRLTVENASPQNDRLTEYEISFRLSNLGTRKSIREMGVVAYVLDEKGKRYDAVPDRLVPPFDIPMPPGKSLRTSRRFYVPHNAGRLELVITRPGFSWRWFVIGRTPLDGHTVMHIE